MILQSLIDFKTSVKFSAHFFLRESRELHFNSADHAFDHFVVKLTTCDEFLLRRHSTRLLQVLAIELGDQLGRGIHTFDYSKLENRFPHSSFT